MGFGLNVETMAFKAGNKLGKITGLAQTRWGRRVVLCAGGVASITMAVVFTSQVPVGSANAAVGAAEGNDVSPAMIAAMVGGRNGTGGATSGAYGVEDLVEFGTAGSATQPADAVLASSKETDAPELLQDEGKKVRPKVAATEGRVMWMEVTGYCSCTKCCGGDAAGVTASGKPVSYNRGKFVAADTRVLPFGTKLSIPGYHDGNPVEVIDRGGAIKGKKLDLFFDSHSAAKQWGRKMIPVVVMDAE